MTVPRARWLCIAALSVLLFGLAAVTSGQVQAGTNVVVALTTNQTLYAPGEPFELGRTLDLVRPSAQAQGDLFVRMQDPGGRVICLGSDLFEQPVVHGTGTI